MTRCKICVLLTIGLHLLNSLSKCIQADSLHVHQSDQEIPESSQQEQQSEQVCTPFARFNEIISNTQLWNIKELIYAQGNVYLWYQQKMKID